MQTIKLLSAIDPIAITSANFPSLQHAWVADGIVGNVIPDQIGDCDITAGSSIAVVDNTFAITDPARNVAGTFFIPGQRDILAIFCGTMVAATTRFVFGDLSGTVGSYLSLAGDANAFMPGLDADQYISYAASGITLTEGAMVFAYDNSAAAASCATRYMIEDATITATVGADSTPTFGTAVDLPAMSQEMLTGSGGTGAWGGWFIWAFPSGELPSASFIKAAGAWMAKNPGEVYPGLLGK